MRIATKLKIAVLAPIVMAFVLVLAIAFSNHALKKAQENLTTVRDVVSSVNNLNSLVYSYMLYQQERPKEQFLAEHKKITRLISSIQVSDEEQKRLVTILQSDVDSMKGLFVKMAFSYERLKIGTADVTIQEAGQRLGGQLLAASSQTVADGLWLAKSVSDRISVNEKRLYQLVFLLILAATIILTLTLAGTMKKISASLAKVAKGAEIIGSGDLDHRIAIATTDEIGEVARSFDAMAGKLAHSYKELKKREEELRDSEARLRLAIEATGLGTFDYFPPSGELIWSDYAKLHFGLPPTANVNFETFVSGLHPDDRGRVSGIVNVVLQKGSGGTYMAEYRTVGIEDKKERWLDARGRVYFDNDRPVRLIGTTMDITERKHAEQERESLILQLERSNRELQEFAFISSHDLQEPLRILMVYTDLLRNRYEGKLDARADKYISYLLKAAERMSSLIKDVLAFSRIASQIEVFQEVEMELVLNDALKNLEKAIAETNAKITNEPLPHVEGDRNQLTLLVQNLLDNALKFRRNEVEPRIFVSAVKQETQWLFGIHDNGIGIDRQFYDKIFIIFQRLHPEYPGTGMGLALCRKVVELHGGRIWVESTVGKGSSFYFSFPIPRRYQ